MKVVVCIKNNQICDNVMNYGIYVAKILKSQISFVAIMENQELGDSFYGLAAGGIVLGEKDMILSNYQNLEQENNEETLKKMQEYLDKCVKKASLEGLKAEQTLKKGDFIDIISTYKNEADMFITAARYDESDDIDFNANMLIKELKVPVLLINKEFSPIKSVLLAFDGTLSSVKIAGFIHNSPLFSNAKKYIINISENEEKSKEALKIAKDIIGEENAKYVYINGTDAGEEIIKFRRANKLDLIATGSFSKNFLKKLIVGSVSQEVITNALVPILVVA